MNSELKKRIPTAIIYVIVILGSLLTGIISSKLLLILLFGLCLFEFIAISKNTNSPTIIFSPLFLVCIALLGISLFLKLSEMHIYLLVMASITYLVVNGICVLWKAKVLFVKSVNLLNIIPYLILPFFITILMIDSHPNFNYLLICLFVLIWLNDAGAYFVGKLIGRHKLYPKISPGKTWEGFIGGGVLTLLAGFGIFKLYGYYDLPTWIFISTFVWIFAVIGDFSESAWKRHYGIKDSGSVLPGHGGFLDRLDSFIYTTPILALLVHHFSKI